MELFPYQREGAAFLADRKRALLRDRMGLGKTAQAIEACRLLDVRDPVVVCPAIARGVWEHQFSQWAPSILPTIFSYDEFRMLHFGRRTPAPPQALILDEAHYLKTRESARTKALYGRYCDGGYAAQAGHVWALSGTFAPNHAGEYWTHFHALFNEAMAEAHWLKRYCVYRRTQFGPVVSANKRENIPELNEKIRAVSLGRSIKDVGLELPPLFWGELPIPPRDAEAAAVLARIEADALREEDYLRRLQRGETPEFAEAEAQAHLTSIRRESGRIKADLVGRLVGAELLNKEMPKVVIFAIYHDVLDTLERMLADFEPVRVDGKTSKRERNKRVHRFQTYPRCKVFLGQIQSCSTAITLTAAHHVVFAEQSLVPGENVQAASRCHRIGQVNPVSVRVATIAGTIDEAVDRVLNRKARMLAELA